jgi:homoserine dehydrogenase
MVSNSHMNRLEGETGKLLVVRIGMLGFGVVGTGAYRMLKDNQESIFQRTGVTIEIAKVGVRDINKKREIPSEFLTTDLESIVNDPHIDVILELMGGVEPAGRLIEKALQHGKHVVTANKELLAKHGSRLVYLASQLGLDLHFEAAVGGGIPLIQPIKHQLSGNKVLKMMGILNGTTNYILTKMAQEGSEFGNALAEAQAKGYAEADPTSDVEGFDAQYKLAILSSIAFNKEVSPEGVYREGIRNVTKKDIQYAKSLGFSIKLLGIVERLSSEKILARVHPTFISKDHPLSGVDGVYNAVWLRGDFVGDVMFSGRGAGARPTGSAVVGDLIDVCRNMRLGGSGNFLPYNQQIEAAPIEQLHSKYYLRMVIQDRPKALGCIATVFGNCNVSISAMEAGPLGERNLIEIVFLIHPCYEHEFLRALKALKNIHIVENISSWFRLED